MSRSAARKTSTSASAGPAAVSNSSVKFCASSRLDRGAARSDQRYSPVSLSTKSRALLNSGSEARAATGTSTVSPATRRAITEVARRQRADRVLSEVVTRLTNRARQLARHAPNGVRGGWIGRFHERGSRHDGVDDLERAATPSRFPQRHGQRVHHATERLARRHVTQRYGIAVADEHHGRERRRPRTGHASRPWPGRSPQR